MQFVGHIFVASLLILAASVTLLACDCIRQSESDSYKTADTVFIGTVIHNDASGESTVFEVNQWLKGKGPWGERLVISGGTDCDASFAEGFVFVVYAKEIEGRLIAPSCLSTTHLNYRQPRLTSLPDAPPNLGPTRFKTRAFLSCPNIEQRLSYGRIAVITSFCVAKIGRAHV